MIDEAALVAKMLEYAPREAEITRIEYEGPSIAIYSRNPAILLQHGYLITELATKLKKRVIIRAEASERIDPEEAKIQINKILQPNYEAKKLFFDKASGEVHVYVEPYPSQKELTELSLRIIAETKWFPVFKRYSPPLSRTVDFVYNVLSVFHVERKKFLTSLGNRIFREALNPSKDIRIRVLGGADEVGRSAFLVETSETSLLVEFGLKPGVAKRTEAFPRVDLEFLDLEELDGVIITHAHLDHCGLVPYLFKYGYRGPVYVTEPTLPLMVLLQLDLIEVTEKNGGVPPYSVADVRKMISHTITLKYGQVTGISPDVKLTFYNAGHVLGSAIAHLHITEGVHNIVFTGDFKYAPTLLLDMAYDKFTRAETVIMESTYGAPTDIMPPRRVVEELLIDTINSIVQNGGKVLIPVPAVGRAQEILAILDRSIREGKLSEIPIYVDGMIDESSSIHLQFANYLSSKIRSLINQGINPFRSEQFVIVKNSSQREEAIREGPCVIISTSGMMEGGPVIEYFRNLAGDSRNMLLFVSYQVSGTLGRRILDGAKNILLPSAEGKMESISVNCKVFKIEGFSGHSDFNQLLAFVKKIQRLIKNLYLVHGESEKIMSLSQSIRKTVHVNARPLKLLQTVYLA